MGDGAGCLVRLDLAWFRTRVTELPREPALHLPGFPDRRAEGRVWALAICIVFSDWNLQVCGDRRQESFLLLSRPRPWTWSHQGEGRWSALAEALGGRQNGFASTLSDKLTLLSCFLPYKRGRHGGHPRMEFWGGCSRAPGHIPASRYRITVPHCAPPCRCQCPSETTWTRHQDVTCCSPLVTGSFIPSLNKSLTTTDVADTS